MRKISLIALFFILLSIKVPADSFIFNSLNNTGSIGLINSPTARFYDESSFGLTAYYGDPDQKITLTSYPYDWLEASFFYTNINNIPYCKDRFDPVCGQDYKDKGFNFKIRLKEEDNFPAIAIGINDIGGTGFYGSEYIVASYGLNKTDFHLGIGWGTLDGSDKNFKNPLGRLHDNFFDRPDFQGEGGQFDSKRYFSGATASPFFGISHVINKKLLIKLEYDTTLTPGLIGHDAPSSDYSYGFDYSLSKNFVIGLSSERGNNATVRFVYKVNSKIEKPKYRYKKLDHKKGDDQYKKLVRNLESNGIGVNKIIEKPDSLGIELTQFTHSNLDIVEEIIRSASLDAGINKDIKKDLRIADLQVISEYDDNFEKNSQLIYERNKQQSFSTNTVLSFRPFLASREEFFKGSILLDNNSEYIFKDNFFFSSNIKYSLADNFGDLIIPPEDTYPAQVRSDVKDYLRNFENRVIIGRAQFDYHINPKSNNYLMFTAGILEEMFNGIGFEYLYFNQDSNFAIGFEIFDVQKRDYELRFGTLDYQNITSHLNFYYRNYRYIPFDTKISYGEYLAGDEGFTIDLSRTFSNGTKFGVFASFTDVTSDQFGEGSFDKGIYFSIPVFSDLINYSWRPLTKDPGAKLNRKHTLYDLLVKFKPYN